MTSDIWSASNSADNPKIHIVTKRALCLFLVKKKNKLNHMYANILISNM